MSSRPIPDVLESIGQALPPGTRLEEFVIERVLGSGGFGITYLACDAKLGRQVVIKENLPVQFAYRDTQSLTVRPRHTEGGDAESFAWSLENFEKEAAMLASLDHPGIVRVLRSFEAFGTAYFVMPHVEGASLEEEIGHRKQSRKPFTAEELRMLLGKLLDALDYLHGRGICHRDIKPGNILLVDGGDPVLIDFGAARLRLSERSLTVIESPGYTPYEQLQSRGKIGPWSDLYALGGTLHKLVSGEPPVKSADRFPDDPVEFLAGRSDLAARYGAELLETVDRSLILRIEQRWQKAGQWREALRAQITFGSRSGSYGKGAAGGMRGVPRSQPEMSGGGAMEGARAGEMRTFGEIEMVWCPPGEFVMGSPEGEEGRSDDERQHLVALTQGFWLAKTECTQGQWKMVMGSNPSWFGRFRRFMASLGMRWGEDYQLLPVESVGDNVQEWITKMGKRHPLPEGWEWNLPSEAQWEYACRAGVTEAYGGTGVLDEMGWYLSNSQGKTRKVGEKAPNAWGLYDMHGNVWELCRDWYAEYPIGPVTDPIGPKSGSKCVCRGGSWNGPAHRCRAASRGRSFREEGSGWGSPGARYSRLGFRIAAVPADR